MGMGMGMGMGMSMPSSMAMSAGMGMSMGMGMGMPMGSAAGPGGEVVTINEPSVCIPWVSPDVSRDLIVSTFEQFGRVQQVDLVPRDDHFLCFIHFLAWNVDDAACRAVRVRAACACTHAHNTSLGVVVTLARATHTHTYSCTLAHTGYLFSHCS
jgi:hypothetical protein